MTNLTITLDETVIRKARIRAITEGTSVSAKVREFLASYANVASAPAQPAGFAFLEVAKKSKANSKAAKWSRADAYDRAYPAAKSA